MSESSAAASVSPGYNIIDAQGLSKRYPGQKAYALEDFTLAIPQGTIFGLIGPNGAGKSSVLKILATLLQPDRGDVYVAGVSVRRNPHKIRYLIGYMPDEYGLYQNMRVAEYLEFFAACYGIHGKRKTRLIGELLELVELDDRRNQELGTLSRGMKQRLCLAHTLVHDPKVLLLDEPAAGLDPPARIELRELLRELSRMGKTIILSSHVLNDVQQMCDTLGIMAHGRLLSYGPTVKVVNQIDKLPRRGIKLRVLSEADLHRAVQVAENFPLLTKRSVHTDPESLTLEALLEGDDRTSAAFLAHLTMSGIFVAQYGQSTARLEELFLKG